MPKWLIVALVAAAVVVAAALNLMHWQGVYLCVELDLDLNLNLR